MNTLIKNIGLTGFIVCILLFTALLFTGEYTLTKTNFQNSVNGYTNGGKSDAEILQPYFEKVFDQSYSSPFTFINLIDSSIQEANNAAIKDGKPENCITNKYTLCLTKSSLSGWMSNYNAKILLCIVFFLICPIFAIIYFFPYKKSSNGIKNNGIYFTPSNNRGWVAWIVFSFLIGFYCILYFSPQFIANWIAITDPISLTITGNNANEWFFYGFIYCIIMVTMGIRMIWKYKGNRYQFIRTLSVIFFQVCFAFLLPNLITELHGSDLKNIWPLDYSYFEGYKIENHLGNNAPISATLVYIWGIALFLIGVPVFTYFFGKRWYCSWVCGCGGLAETFGDPFRQNSSKKLIAWRLERILIHSVLVFAIIMTVLLILAYFKAFDEGGAGFVKYIYGFFIGSLFSGVIGTGFYPMLGSRVWCRFGCPLAAYIGIWQRKKSRFRITTNGSQCISCGNCSTYCEMGIDVRWYAQRGQNIVRASCVGCGICSSVCPRGVLKLENGPLEKRINENPKLIGLKNVKH